MDQTIKINKYLPIAVLYFFFNSFLLPAGLMYTTLLTPLFLIWLYRYPSFNYLWIFFLVSIPFALVHFSNGVNILLYAKSYLLFLSVYVFGIAFYQFLKQCNTLGNIYKNIVLLNFLLLPLALIALAIPSLTARFWYNNPITSGISSWYRLKMLTYEPSYYALLLAPIVLYYILKMYLMKVPNGYFTLLLLVILLLLSLSFGVILGMMLALIFILLSDMKLFFFKKKLPTYFILAILLGLVALVIGLQFFPDNIFFLRIANVFQGKDVSFKGRTFDSFYLGWKIAEQKSVLFGVGPGQMKPIGLPFFKEFYNYTDFKESEIGIPNSIGDTLASLGVLGVLARLVLQVYFFFKTKVYSNFYRLALFLFVFIYQFTGSFITNIAEYVVWIMAFSPWLFKEFDKEVIFKEANFEAGRPLAVST